MTEFYLITQDTALEGAIAEQLAQAGLGPTHTSNGLTAALANEDAIIILDAAAVDKKVVKNLREPNGGKKAKIFLLDESEEIPEELVTENFSMPLRLGHLLARIQFHMQAATRLRAPFTFGRWRLEPQNRQVILENEVVVRLTEKETNLLEYLGKSAAPVSHEELLAAIWGYDDRIDTHTLETHIYRLRRKLDPEGKGWNAIIFEQGAYYLAK